MLRSLMILLFTLVSRLAVAEVAPVTDEVILLTSIAPQTRLSWERELIARQEQKLARIFEKRWEGENVRVHIAHHVDAEKLYRVIQGPGVKALFYVGHAGSNSTASVVTDYQNRNVRRLFEKVSPDLSFLAVIGCHVEKPALVGAAGLEFYSAPGFQEASIGLENAIAAAKRSLARPKRPAALTPARPTDCTLETCVPVTIHRRLSAASLARMGGEFPPLQVSAADRPGVLGVTASVSREFVEREGEWTQHFTFWLPRPASTALPTLRVESGTASLEEGSARAELGSLTVEIVGDAGHYIPLVHRDGTPVGVSSALFVYRPEGP